MMTFKRNQKHSGGFSLLEMIIAIAIFGVLSMLAYTGLTTVIRTQKGTEKVMDRLNELQKAMMFLQRDIEQSVNRPIRDDAGFNQPSFTGGGTDNVMLELTRTGWQNPAKKLRSNLQRVSYELRDDDDGNKELIRQNYFHLDRATLGEPTEFTILSKIESVEVEFVDDQGKTSTTWPANSFTLNNDAPSTLPIAVQLTITLKDWGEFRRLFRVSDAI